MKLWFSWAGIKKDGRNKTHVWGILNCDENHTTQKYIFWGPVGGPIYKRPADKLEYLFNKKNQKIKNGYRVINQSEINTKWPQILDDLEMQFVIEKLS